MELNEFGQKMKEQESKTRSKRYNLILSYFLLCLLFVPFSAQCQTWDEIFRQKETQKQYFLEQIAALKIYAGYLKKGYDIASTGLQTVKDISNGEFNLHQSFISSLKTVNPAIRNDIRVAEIVGFQIEIRNALKGIRESEALSASEKSYIESVRNEVIKECSRDLEELLLIVTSGRIQFTDNDRIKRLNEIYGSMRDKSAFTQSYRKQVNLLISQKINEQKSVNQIQHLYEKE